MACWNTLNPNIHKLAIYIFKCNTDTDLNRNSEIEIDFALLFTFKFTHIHIFVQKIFVLNKNTFCLEESIAIEILVINRNR